MKRDDLNPVEKELDRVRSEWSAEQWDNHFESLGILPAGDARYGSGFKDNVPRNDVLKFALAESNNYKCWYQGGQCRSRALSLRELQIDHVVPRSCSASNLEKALNESSVQKKYFDVHDPGNLSIICGPCNTERPKEPKWTTAYTDRILKCEENRDSVIKKVIKWHRETGISKTALEALQGASVADGDTWEVLSEIMADLIMRKSGLPYDFSSGVNFVAISESFQFELSPSEALIDYYIEQMSENRLEEGKIDRYLESRSL